VEDPDPESLIRAMAPSSVVWTRTCSTPSTAVRAWRAIFDASATIVITSAAAITATTMPSTSPTAQPVEAPTR
jgi:hypothetical protein